MAESTYKKYMKSCINTYNPIIPIYIYLSSLDIWNL